MLKSQIKYFPPGAPVVRLCSEVWTLLSPTFRQLTVRCFISAPIARWPLNLPRVPKGTSLPSIPHSQLHRPSRLIHHTQPIRFLKTILWGYKLRTIFTGWSTSVSCAIQFLPRNLCCTCILTLTWPNRKCMCSNVRTALNFMLRKAPWWNT